MLDLTIHDIDEAVLDRLRARPARKGISLEEEARRTIVDHVAGDEEPSSSENSESAWDAFQRLKAKHGGGVDFEPLDRSEWKDRPVDFGEGSFPIRTWFRKFFDTKPMRTWHAGREGSRAPDSRSPW